MKNPLRKRVLREIRRDWHRYIVIILFIVIMIGVVAGMDSGRDSMMKSIHEGQKKYCLEDGCFELNKKAEPALLARLESGKKADVRQYFIDKGYKKADKKVAEKTEEALQKKVRKSIENKVRESCDKLGDTKEEMLDSMTQEAMDQGFDQAVAKAKESRDYQETLQKGLQMAGQKVEQAAESKLKEQVKQGIEQQVRAQAAKQQVPEEMIPELVKKAQREGFAQAYATAKQSAKYQEALQAGKKQAEEKVRSVSEQKLQETVREKIREEVQKKLDKLGSTKEEIVARMTRDALEDNYEKALKKARESKAFQRAVRKAYRKAHRKVREKVDEKWEDIKDQYDIDDPDFKERPIKVVESFYRNENEDQDRDGKTDATLRAYRSDASTNMACFLEGRKPKKSGEIAIDRMHADNVGVKPGDTIRVGKRDFKIVGLLSYVNYLTLHEKNTDFMFDAFGFDVGMVIPEDFESLDARKHYRYSFFYEEKPSGDIEEADMADDFMKVLITSALVEKREVKDFIPGYQNQAVHFAPSDIEGDTGTTEIFIYVLIAVIAFVFAITITGTIEKESTVIGTLRASGYTKGELVRHYMAAPLVITLIGAVLGNVLGYTLFNRTFVALYYNSYSLPTYSLVYNPVTPVRTTLIPLTLMMLVNFVIIVRSLRISPLRFLRKDLKRQRRAKAIRLPRWSFLNRFRLRIALQNVPNYLILIFGVVFIELMLCFSFGLPSSLNHYSDRAPDMLFCKYQYMLMGMEDEDGDPIRTANQDAEKFSTETLVYQDQEKNAGGQSGLFQRGAAIKEDVSVYGYSKGSRYIDLPDTLKKNEVYLSKAFALKYELRKGDRITLAEKYENKTYSFTVGGVFDYEGGVAVFLPNSSFNEVFDKDGGDFNGYFSNTRITDIDEDNIATVMTKKDITKITDQLQHSMGQFMKVFQIALFFLAVALIYLLTKIIIEKNETPISMTKILGFVNREIGSLYIAPTTVVVLLFTGVGFVAGYYLMENLFKIFLKSMSGYFAFYMGKQEVILSILVLLVGYVVVTVIDYFRICKVPMDEALKNVE